MVVFCCGYILRWVLIFYTYVSPVLDDILKEVDY